MSEPRAPASCLDINPHPASPEDSLDFREPVEARSHRTGLLRAQAGTAVLRRRSDADAMRRPSLVAPDPAAGARLRSPWPVSR
jgi:hypothetical protein